MNFRLGFALVLLAPVLGAAQESAAPEPYARRALARVEQRLERDTTLKNLLEWGGEDALDAFQGEAFLCLDDATVTRFARIMARTIKRSEAAGTEPEPEPDR